MGSAEENVVTCCAQSNLSSSATTVGWYVVCSAS